MEPVGAIWPQRVEQGTPLMTILPPNPLILPLPEIPQKTLNILHEFHMQNVSHYFIY